MKAFHRVAAALACMSLAATVFSVPVRAQEGQRGTDNLVTFSGISAMVVGNEPSDTLDAVRDGLRWPDAPHSGSGANPYAWTNYTAAQKYPWGNSWLKFDFPAEDSVQAITVYYFVDSWSASIPKDVNFVFTDANGYAVEHAVWGTEPVQMAGTCWRQVYNLKEPIQAKSAQIIFTNADGQKHAGVNKCVGVYEIEIDSGMPAPVTDPEDGQKPIIHYIDGYETPFEEIEINPYRIVSVGSEETEHEKFVTFLYDEDPNTIWHSAWEGCKPEDMYLYFYFGKSEPFISGIRYLPRSGNKSGDNNGRIAAYEVQTRDWSQYDGTDWARTGWRTVATGRFEDTEGWKEIRLDKPLVGNETLEIRLVATETYGVKPNTWMSAAEVRLLGGRPIYD